MQGLFPIISHPTHSLSFPSAVTTTSAGIMQLSPPYYTFFPPVYLSSHVCPDVLDLLTLIDTALVDIILLSTKPSMSCTTTPEWTDRLISQLLLQSLFFADPGLECEKFCLSYMLSCMLNMFILYIFFFLLLFFSLESVTLKLTEAGKYTILVRFLRHRGFHQLALRV
jgi:hypothetical protein